MGFKIISENKAGTWPADEFFSSSRLAGFLQGILENIKIKINVLLETWKRRIAVDEQISGDLITSKMLVTKGKVRYA